MLDKFKSFKNKFISFLSGKFKRVEISWLILGLIFTLIIDILQGSLFRLFILNYLIFLSLTSIALLFKKPKTLYFLISGIILCLAIASAVVMKFRGTPLTAGDMYSIKDGISIAKNYLGDNFIIIIGAIIIIAIIVLVISFLKEKSLKEFSFKRSLFIIVIPTIVITAGVYKLDNSIGLIKNYNWDLAQTYKSNGFLVSYYKSIRELKPEKPENYTKENIDRIKDNLTNKAINVSNNSEENPNIIVVQLESFLDPYRLKGIKLSKDPIPNIRKLEAEGPHGLMGVPTYGGGTVRTEFEVLTGYSAANLGAGEIPNNTILKKQAVESLANILKEDGYDVTAIHNYEGNFYDRDTVYSNFGFDKFVSMEYIKDLKYNDYNGKSEYPADISNIEPIKEILSNEKQPQFIFNVAVETHGPYSEKYIPVDGKYTVEGNITEEERNQLQEYVDRLSAVDNYVAELVNVVKATGKPTIIAFYSDHLPMLKILDNPNIFPENKYQSNYFIWSNMGTKPKEENIMAYQLSTRILDIAGINKGIMPLFHKNNEGKENYSKDFKNLQYDQLSGENYLGAEKPKKAKDMQLGLEQIKITNAYNFNGNLVVDGENFTSASKVFIDNKEMATEFVSPNQLIVYNEPNEINFKVCQVGKGNKKLSFTEEYRMKK